MRLTAYTHDTRSTIDTLQMTKTHDHTHQFSPPQNDPLIFPTFLTVIQDNYQIEKKCVHCDSCSINYYFIDVKILKISIDFRENYHLTLEHSLFTFNHKLLPYIQPKYTTGLNFLNVHLNSHKQCFQSIPSRSL